MRIPHTHSPISTEHIALFIAHLAKNSYTASTVMTYISAIGFVHRMAALPDPTKVHLIQLALRGYSKIHKHADIRLPISLPMLEQIVSPIDHTIDSDYQRKMMKAMCTAAFFAALRIGEITKGTAQLSRNVINLNQVSFIRDAQGMYTSYKITMQFFKHHDSGHPIDITLCTSKPICPVLALIHVGHVGCPNPTIRKMEI